MKQAISISIGSSKRDKIVETELLGQKIQIERRGTDGDMEVAANLYRELDGKVDAFGIGGALLGLMVDEKWYTMHSVKPLVRFIKKTPAADGTGLKMTLERMAAQVLEENIGPLSDKNVMLTSGVDRYGLFRSFYDKGCSCRIADLMFALGLNIPIHSDERLKFVASLIAPPLGRVPFDWLYPTGEKQDVRTPKFGQHFAWADVVAGDCHYITKYMPDDMRGKAVVTNTTTQHDLKLFREAGVKYLVTTTPNLDGRTFGTNAMEASILAVTGWKEPVDYTNPEKLFGVMREAIKEIGIRPQFQEL
ncbi:MAG: hypothetical protein JEZ06_20330 [Anaerolineaceae bacterium]|nr:hypothetical protein [Anaerolineaceae bacterium]